MKEDLSERGPISGLTVPANPKQETQLCTLSMPSKINNVFKTVHQHLPVQPHSETGSTTLLIKIICPAIRFQPLLTSTV